MDGSRHQLTEQEALAAMTCFLEHFFTEAGNDMYTLLADLSLDRDGGTLDPAAWADWMQCIEQVVMRRQRP